MFGTKTAFKITNYKSLIYWCFLKYTTPIWYNQANNKMILKHKINPSTLMSDQTRISLTISIQHQYNINQISDENGEKYQYGDN